MLILTNETMLQKLDDNDPKIAEIFGKSKTKFSEK